jgi:hypothetical protein
VGPPEKEYEMWVLLNDAFLSIVQDKDDRSRLLVRARCREDIERVFAGAAVVEGAGSDYAYRAFLPRGTVAATLTARVEEIDYPNFKDSVREAWRHDASLAVWRVLRRGFLGR